MLVGSKFLGCMPKFGKWDQEKYTKILSDLLMYSHEVPVTDFVIGPHV